MKNTLKLSLLTILAIPLFIMNVSAKEIVEEDTTYQRGTFENKIYNFDENVADFQELQIDGEVVNGVAEIVDEDTISLDWNYLENINNLEVGDHTLSFVFEGATINTSITINEITDHESALNVIFGNVPTEFNVDAVETDAIYDDPVTGENAVRNALAQAVSDSLYEAGYNLEDYGYEYYIYWEYWANDDPSDYIIEMWYNGNWEVDLPIRAIFTNSDQRSEEVAAIVQGILDSSNFMYVRYVPLIDALEAYRTGTTDSLIIPLNEKMAALVEGTDIEVVLYYEYMNMSHMASYLLSSDYFFVYNDIIYGYADVTGGYVSSIYPPEEEIDTTVYMQNYITEQMIAKELMTDTDSILYDEEYNEAVLLSNEVYSFVGYVVYMEEQEVLSGDEVTITTDETLSVRIDNDVDDFMYVTVNEEEVDEKDYTVTSGSTIVTFAQEYTNALAEGVYNLAVYFYDGVAHSAFTITKPVVEEVATSTTPVYTAYTTNYVYQEAETKTEELKEVSEDKEEESKDDQSDEAKEKSSKGSGKGVVIGIIIAVLIAGIGFYLYKEGQE